jgi:hypothetical protein
MWVAVCGWQYVGGSMWVAVCGWQYVGGSMWVAAGHLAVLATVPALAAVAVPPRHCVSSTRVTLVTCRVKVVHSSEEEAAAARAAEELRPSASAQAHRAAGGQYTAEQPFWATITDAQYLSATWSDRKVRTALTLHCSGTALARPQRAHLTPTVGSNDLLAAKLRCVRTPAHAIMLSSKAIMLTTRDTFT